MAMVGMGGAIFCRGRDNGLPCPREDKRSCGHGHMLPFSERALAVLTQEIVDRLTQKGLKAGVALQRQSVKRFRQGR